MAYIHVVHMPHEHSAYYAGACSEGLVVMGASQTLPADQNVRQSQ